MEPPLREFRLPKLGQPTLSPSVKVELLVFMARAGNTSRVGSEAEGAKACMRCWCCNCCCFNALASVRCSRLDVEEPSCAMVLSISREVFRLKPSPSPELERCTPPLLLRLEATGTAARN